LGEQVAAVVEAAEPQPAARDEEVRPREAVRAVVPQPGVRRAAVQAGKAELPPEAVRGGAPVRPTGVAAQTAEQAAGRGAARDEGAPRRAAVRDGEAPLPAVAPAAVRRRVAPDARAVLYRAPVWAVHRGPFPLCPVRQPAARFARGTARQSIASP
jgi:hypothetical protein